MSKAKIITLLVEKGTRLFEGPKEFVRFTKNQEADELLNDLSKHPHAFVIGCVMDRQIKAEKAWIIPHRFRERLGSFEVEELRHLTETEIQKLMSEPKPLHRFVDDMSRNFYEAIGLISENYGGNAANIWQNRPSSAETVYRFLKFRGVGPKIATMATNILARGFKVPLTDYYSVDVSVDRHVSRVLSRLGLVTLNDSRDTIVYRARALHPEFPGLLDFPAYEIGKNWCHPSKPLCGDCYMNSICPKVGRNG